MEAVYEGKREKRKGKREKGKGKGEREKAKGKRQKAKGRRETSGISRLPFLRQEGRCQKPTMNFTRNVVPPRLSS